jgi:hypothetical protein
MQEVIPGGQAGRVEAHPQVPWKLWDDKNEAKKTGHPAKVQPQETGTCGSTCKTRRKLWKEELTSLTTLVGAVAMLLTVITPSKGAGVEDGADKCQKWEHEPGMAGLVTLDYWMLLPLILMVTTGLVVRVKGYLEGRQEFGDEGPILSRVGGVDLPAARGGPAAFN